MVGAFTIGAESGAWRLVTYQDREELRSRDFAIAAEVDLAPEVMLDAPEEVLELALDEAMALSWRARDDYGVSRVTIEIDGRETGKVLASPRERRAEVSGLADPRPVDLGLSSGDRVKLSIAAWDNDAVSGSKVGRSQAIEIVVLGSRGIDLREDERQRKLRDLLVDVLAGYLEEPWPPGPTSGHLADWGEEVGGRYSELDAIIERWGGRPPSAVEGNVMQGVSRSGRELIRYTQTAFLQGSKSVARDSDVQVTAALRDEALGSVENGILALDYMLKKRAFTALSEASKKLADIATDLERMLEGDATAQELLSRLDHLEAARDDLASQAARLEEGNPLKEFVNQRSNEMDSLSEEIRKAIADGRLEEARELMARLAQQIEQLAQGIQDQMERGQKEDEEGEQVIQALLEELEALEKEQRSLQEQTQTIREGADEEAARATASLWEQIETKARQHADEASAYAGRIESANRGFNEVTRAENGAEHSAQLREAVVGRDLHQARVALEQARTAWLTAEWLSERLGGSSAEIRSLQAQIDAIEALLDRLEAASQAVDPRTREQTRGLEPAEQDLQRRLEAAAETAQQVARKLPVQPDGLEEGLQDAKGAMERAQQDMREGRPMPAEGSEGTAAERIGEARQALERALEQSRQMQQEGEQGQRGEGGQQGDAQRPQPIELPSPEEFQTPEEYRRELLEGMEGEVPEEYRALKKRYYEELVHQ
jgi:hypothetical protein